MAARRLDVSRTAGGGHKGALVRHALAQLFRLVHGCLIRSERHFHHVGEAELPYRGDELGEARFKLSGDGWGDERVYLFAAVERAHDVHDLAALKDGAEGAGGDAAAAADAFRVVDGGDAVFILLYRVCRAALFAGDGDLGDGVIGADLFAAAAVFAFCFFYS